jgi:hypothetical protein
MTSDTPTLAPGERALWYQAGVFGLAFLPMLALPARHRHTAGPCGV